MPIIVLSFSPPLVCLGSLILVMKQPEDPDVYVRPASDRPCLNDMLHQLEVPVIDLSGLDDQRSESTMLQLAKACEDWGIFQLINHGVPASLMERTLTAATEFFDLPIEEKQVYANKPWSLQSGAWKL